MRPIRRRTDRRCVWWRTRPPEIPHPPRTDLMHAEGPTVAEHRPPARATGGHDAVLYASDGEFVDAAGRHLREGAERGEKLVLACTGERAELLLDSVDGLPAVTQLGNDDTYLTPCG